MLKQESQRNKSKSTEPRKPSKFWKNPSVNSVSLLRNQSTDVWIFLLMIVAIAEEEPTHT